MAERSAAHGVRGALRAAGLACASIAPLLVTGCGGSTPAMDACARGGCVTVSLDFAAKGDDFYAAPFPSDTRLRADGHVDLEGFPVGKGTDLVHRILDLLARDADGFGLTSGVYLELTGAIDPAGLPDLHGSVAEGASVFLIGVTPGAPDYLKRYPITATFTPEATTFGSANLLSLIPLQGVPLRPKTRYAAVVLRTLHAAGRGAALTQASALTALLDGTRPGGMSEPAFASYRAALDALGDAKVDAATLAGLTVFTTGDPAAPFGKVTAAMLDAPMPALDHPFALAETFDDFCVYETSVPMPEYQQGSPPYTSEGGDWAFDAMGTPVLQRMEDAKLVVTVPRRAMPAKGFPLVVMSRTGGGGERPLVDRGVQAMTGGAALIPGTGPALHFARAGFAGSSIDGPHGGLRNITHGDEQFLMFNVGNPRALRDNVRQSAAELVLQARLLASLSVDVSGCPGVIAPGGKAHFDADTLALMGHSMGATIAPLALAGGPSFRAGLLSGAGGSMIANVMYKEHPLVVKGFAEILIGLAGTGESITEHDPLLSLFQWVAEPSDPPVYAERIVHAPASGPPRHILMMQGIVDHYIMPPIANATSLSLGLDLAGDELDGMPAELTRFAPLGTLLDLTGRATIALPASANVQVGMSAVTAVVTQHAEDGIEDGHEVVFQTEGPKHQYRCFLESLAKGAPRVPAPGKATDPCE